MRLFESSMLDHWHNMKRHTYVNQGIRVIENSPAFRAKSITDYYINVNNYDFIIKFVVIQKLFIIFLYFYSFCFIIFCIEIIYSKLSQLYLSIYQVFKYTAQ